MSQFSRYPDTGARILTPSSRREAYGDGLRSSFADILDEPIPDNLQALIDAMRAAEQKE